MRATGLRHTVRRVKDGVDVAHGADVVEPLAQVVALRPQQGHVHGVRPVAGEVDLPCKNVSTQCFADGTGKRWTYQLVAAAMARRLPGVGDWTFGSSTHPRKCSLTYLQGHNETEPSIPEGIG